MRPVAAGGTNAYKGGATPRRALASLTATVRRPYTADEARGEGA